MQQMCLPIPYELYHTIIWYDTLLLGIVVNGEDRYFYIDVTPSNSLNYDAYVLFKIHSDAPIDEMCEELQYKLDKYKNLECMIDDMILDTTHYTLKYGVVSKSFELDKWYIFENSEQIKEFFNAYSWGEHHD